MEQKFCEGCGAVGESCCSAAKSRQETSNALAKIVARQSETIKTLSRERDEARQVVADLRAKVAA